MKKTLLTSLLFSAVLFADFNVGDTLPKITLEDQFEKTFTIEKNDKLMLMAFEKDVSVQINEFLKVQSKNFMSGNHIKYISDISAMPSFITSMFALPKMRKYPFSVMLINDNFGKQFNKKEGKVTVYRLNNRKIKAIQYIDPKQLITIFKK